MLHCHQWLEATNSSGRETPFGRTPDAALALHCGPVLMGQKPAALLSLPTRQLDAARGILDALRGPRCRVLRQSAAALLLVYDEPSLAYALAAPVPRAVLAKLGYPVSGSLNAMLAHLVARIASSRDFPHEVGFFLGYPQRDVLGFMAHRGRDCKLSGAWKVYGDVESAKALWSHYRQCSDRLLAEVFQCGGLIPAMAACG